MSPEAIALANALLEHHKHVCQGTKGVRANIDASIVTYGELCEKVGGNQSPRNIGPFLREIAEWCFENGWPPINALVANQESRMPGEGYDGAPGCGLANWTDEVQACIDFKQYPDRAT